MDRCSNHYIFDLTMEGGGDEKKIDKEPPGLSLPISSGSEEGENGGKNTDDETHFSFSSEKVNNKVRVY